MHEDLLNLLRCPFCGTRFILELNSALRRTRTRIDTGVIGCECCAFPIVAGIPVLLADDRTRHAMQALEAGRHEAALIALLGLDDTRGAAFGRLLDTGDAFTYRNAIELLTPDAEGAYFVYRFSDPTFVMADALVHAIGQEPAAAGRALDICGGSGHLTRTLMGPGPSRETVLADVHFWKLWLASTFTAPDSLPVCCDVNQPLPFEAGSFPMVVLSDAFPYIWHKRLLAGEMLRVAGPDGVVVMPHLHSALGENFSAGMTLTPTSYRNLFVELGPRLFSDEALLTQAIDRTGLDLSDDVLPADLGHEPSLTLVASRHEHLFRHYEPRDVLAVAGVLTINPLYRIERRGRLTELTLTFPTPEYEEEFGACRRYLPATVRIDVDLSKPITPATVGPRYAELLRRQVLIDTPLRYC
jgi:uncharacterized protein YbaR (Trm112 family)